MQSEYVSINNQLDRLSADSLWSTVKDFVENNSSSALAPYLILTHIYNLADYDDLASYYNLLSPEIKNHRYAQKTQIQLSTLANVMVGKMAPNFTLNDTSGNEVTLNSLKGSFVLIDFWASWCGPCRAENPAMIDFYNEMVTKGVEFEIIGVAADFTEERWKKAVNKDELPWVNVSDVSGFDGKVIQLYGVKSLPYTIILNKKGQIIEKGLTGEPLRKRLGEIVTRGF